MPSVETPVTRALDQLGIPYTLHLHPQPVRTLEQAAAERGLLPEQIVRSLLFRMEDSSYVLLLMPGPQPVDWPKLRHHLGVRRITTASREEVQRITGFEPGAVSPFGLQRRLPLLADRTILDMKKISLGAGIRNAGVVLDRSAAMAALEPDLADFRGE